MDVSESICDGQHNFFFRNEGGVWGVLCKINKLILWSIVAQKGTNILIFHIFEYGAEYGAECSAFDIAIREAIRGGVGEVGTPALSKRVP